MSHERRFDNSWLKSFVFREETVASLTRFVVVIGLWTTVSSSNRQKASVHSPMADGQPVYFLVVLVSVSVSSTCTCTCNCGFLFLCNRSHDIFLFDSICPSATSPFRCSSSIDIHSFLLSIPSLPVPLILLRLPFGSTFLSLSIGKGDEISRGGDAPQCFPIKVTPFFPCTAGSRWPRNRSSLHWKFWNCHYQDLHK